MVSCFKFSFLFKYFTIFIITLPSPLGGGGVKVVGRTFETERNGKLKMERYMFKEILTDSNLSIAFFCFVIA